MPPVRATVAVPKVPAAGKTPVPRVKVPAVVLILPFVMVKVPPILRGVVKVAVPLMSKVIEWMLAVALAVVVLLRQIPAPEIVGEVVGVVVPVFAVLKPPINKLPDEALVMLIVPLLIILPKELKR